MDHMNEWEGMEVEREQRMDHDHRVPPSSSTTRHANSGNKDGMSDTDGHVSQQRHHHHSEAVLYPRSYASNLTLLDISHSLHVPSSSLSTCSPPFPIQHDQQQQHGSNILGLPLPSTSASGYGPGSRSSSPPLLSASSCEFGFGRNDGAHMDGGSSGRSRLSSATGSPCISMEIQHFGAPADNDEQPSSSSSSSVGTYSFHSFHTDMHHDAETTDAEGVGSRLGSSRSLTVICDSSNSSSSSCSASPSLSLTPFPLSLSSSLESALISSTSGSVTRTTTTATTTATATATCHAIPSATSSPSPFLHQNDGTGEQDDMSHEQHPEQASQSTQLLVSEGQPTSLFLSTPSPDVLNPSQQHGHTQKQQQHPPLTPLQPPLMSPQPLPHQIQSQQQHLQQHGAPQQQQQNSSMVNLPELHLSTCFSPLQQPSSPDLVIADGKQEVNTASSIPITIKEEQQQNDHPTVTRTPILLSDQSSPSPSSSVAVSVSQSQSGTLQQPHGGQGQIKQEGHVLLHEPASSSSSSHVHNTRRALRQAQTSMHDTLSLNDNMLPASSSSSSQGIERNLPLRSTRRRATSSMSNDSDNYASSPLATATAGPITRRRSRARSRSVRRSPLNVAQAFPITPATVITQATVIEEPAETYNEEQGEEEDEQMMMKEEEGQMQQWEHQYNQQQPNSQVYHAHQYGQRTWRRNDDNHDDVRMEDRVSMAQYEERPMHEQQQPHQSQTGRQRHDYQQRGASRQYAHPYEQQHAAAVYQQSRDSPTYHELSPDYRPASMTREEWRTRVEMAAAVMNAAAEASRMRSSRPDAAPSSSSAAMQRSPAARSSYYPASHSPHSPDLVRASTSPSSSSSPPAAASFGYGLDTVSHHHPRGRLASFHPGAVLFASADNEANSRTRTRTRTAAATRRLHVDEQSFMRQEQSIQASQRQGYHQHSPPHSTMMDTSRRSSATSSPPPTFNDFSSSSSSPAAAAGAAWTMRAPSLPTRAAPMSRTQPLPLSPAAAAGSGGAGNGSGGGGVGGRRRGSINTSSGRTTHQQQQQPIVAAAAAAAAAALQMQLDGPTRTTRSAVRAAAAAANAASASASASSSAASSRISSPTGRAYLSCSSAALSRSTSASSLSSCSGLTFNAASGEASKSSRSRSTSRKRSSGSSTPLKHCTWPGCVASFTKTSTLLRHIRVHTGERPFVCQVDGCQAAFSEKGNLVRHQLDVHTDLRRFSCPFSNYCKMKFRRASHVAQHVESRHVAFGEDPAKAYCYIKPPTELLSKSEKRRTRSRRSRGSSAGPGSGPGPAVGNRSSSRSRSSARNKRRGVVTQAGYNGYGPHSSSQATTTTPAATAVATPLDPSKPATASIISFNGSSSSSSTQNSSLPPLPPLPLPVPSHVLVTSVSAAVGLPSASPSTLSSSSTTSRSMQSAPATSISRSTRRTNITPSTATGAVAAPTTYRTRSSPSSSSAAIPTSSSMTTTMARAIDGGYTTGSVSLSRSTDPDLATLVAQAATAANAARRNGNTQHSIMQDPHQSQRSGMGDGDGDGDTHMDVPASASNAMMTDDSSLTPSAASGASMLLNLQHNATTATSPHSAAAPVPPIPSPLSLPPSHPVTRQHTSFGDVTLPLNSITSQSIS